MKRISLLATLLLTACVSPVDDILNNQFTTIKATPINDDRVVNTWTASIASYLTTLKMNADGTGVFCQSAGASNAIEKVKFTDGTFYFQNGAKMTFESVNNNQLTLFTRYYGNKNETNFIADGDLKEASIYCQKELTQL